MSVIISNGCGTRGYCEPEYFSTGFVTKKSDVFSFGVVLFEVLCGRLCLIDCDDGFSLSNVSAREHYEKNKLDKIIDHSLKEHIGSNSMTKFAAIAYRCLHNDREKRPAMDVVAKELEEALRSLNNCSAFYLGEIPETMDIGTAESFQYEFSTVQAATKDFSKDNQLGRGGFGAVYKGVLEYGKEIAVKRLADNSGQGVQEFKNEVVLVTKLQHRNLVRLLGFSIHGHERLLIYEFLPNTSLDHFLFDPAKRDILDWEKRYKIIKGVAKGLLYLHEDARLMIIHRDMKASNVLLDAEMNAKIADFGLARLFKQDETQAKISRTRTYMPPEYIMHGHFSVKTDVYSFGVLVLEIVAGQRHGFQTGETIQNLLSSAWKRWQNGTTSEIIDPTLKTRSIGSLHNIIRSILIGLLCVQENVNDRPTMGSVVNMLSNLSIEFPQPSRPPEFSSSSGSSGLERPELSKIDLPLSHCCNSPNDYYDICWSQNDWFAFHHGEIGEEEDGDRYYGYSFQYNTVQVATNDFSEHNKLGVGGYGAVYKGVLQGRQEIAVKRLADDSGQGVQEFKNEVLGCLDLAYMDMNDIFIYEFLRNESLDHFLFDPTKRDILDWEKRYKIIKDVAKGLLYLHEDSPLKIIHRDMKASNVLLDAEMNAKIADFGMARLFKQDETHAKTSQIVGTRAYMPPEYIIHGHFSVKTDVYSFGVLVLEIVAGQRNDSFQTGETIQNLVSSAWKKWQNDTTSEIIDPTLTTRSTGSLPNIIRSIHIGLLCVQENVNDRPTIGSVVNMLNNLSIKLLQPSRPSEFSSSSGSSGLERPEL